MSPGTDGLTFPPNDMKHTMVTHLLNFRGKGRVYPEGKRNNLGLLRPPSMQHPKIHVTFLPLLVGHDGQQHESSRILSKIIHTHTHTCTMPPSQLLSDKGVWLQRGGHSYTSITALSQKSREHSLPPFACLCMRLQASVFGISCSFISLSHGYIIHAQEAVLQIES